MIKNDKKVVWKSICRNDMACKIIPFMLYIYKFVIIIAHSGLKMEK